MTAPKFPPRVCSVCGRLFQCSLSQHWAWRASKRTVNVCSSACYNQAREAIARGGAPIGRLSLDFGFKFPASRLKTKTPSG